MVRNWKRWVGILLWLLILFGPALGAVAQEARHVDVLQIEGAVTPIMISYIQRGIRTAEADGAEALIVELNTPGGQIDLMSKIVQSLLDADVPVVVYVYPKGAYAASAGTLITLAGHVAAMAPGTTIGAASPVGSEGEDLGETMETKVKEDLKAQARALTERRGEQAVAWAESAIQEAKAATAQEALDLGVIDFVAADLDDLLGQLDGFKATVDDRDVVLHTAGAQIQRAADDGRRAVPAHRHQPDDRLHPADGGPQRHPVRAIQPRRLCSRHRRRDLSAAGLLFAWGCCR